MPNKADKFDLRLRMVKSAIANGVKPTPLRCPHRTSPALERSIVNLRKQYPFVGAKRLKYFHQRVASCQAWYNIVRVNSNKDYKASWQIIRKVEPKTNVTIPKCVVGQF